jgi:hypothetical protein
VQGLLNPELLPATISYGWATAERSCGLPARAPEGPVRRLPNAAAVSTDDGRAGAATAGRTCRHRGYREGLCGGL